MGRCVSKIVCRGRIGKAIYNNENDEKMIHNRRENDAAKHYSRQGYDGGMRDWKTSLPLRSLMNGLRIFLKQKVLQNNIYVYNIVR